VIADTTCGILADFGSHFWAHAYSFSTQHRHVESDSIHRRIEGRPEQSRSCLSYLVMLEHVARRTGQPLESGVVLLHHDLDVGADFHGSTATTSRQHVHTTISSAQLSSAHLTAQTYPVFAHRLVLVAQVFAQNLCSHKHTTHTRHTTHTAHAQMGLNDALPYVNSAFTYGEASPEHSQTQVRVSPRLTE
jgi:hypothetical protein